MPAPTYPNTEPNHEPRYYYRQTFNPLIWLVVDSKPRDALSSTYVVARCTNQSHAQLVTNALNQYNTQPKDTN
jgi:hypothetical protein